MSVYEDASGLITESQCARVSACESMCAYQISKVKNVLDVFMYPTVMNACVFVSMSLSQANLGSRKY